jgi:hypothetical protein
MMHRPTVLTRVVGDNICRFRCASSLGLQWNKGEFFLQVFFLLSLQVIPLFIFAFPFCKIILVVKSSQIFSFIGNSNFTVNASSFVNYLAVAVTIPSRLANDWLISIRVLHSHLNLQKHRCGTTLSAKATVAPHAAI